MLELIQSDHTYLNERLARHYGIEGVHGNHFRKLPSPLKCIVVDCCDKGVFYR